MFPFLRRVSAAPSPNLAALRAAEATLAASCRALAAHLNNAARDLDDCGALLSKQGKASAAAKAKHNANQYRQIAEEWLG